MVLPERRRQLASPIVRCDRAGQMARDVKHRGASVAPCLVVDDTAFVLVQLRVDLPDSTARVNSPRTKDSPIERASTSLQLTQAVKGSRRTGSTCSRRYIRADRTQTAAIITVCGRSARQRYLAPDDVVRAEIPGAQCAFAGGTLEHPVIGVPDREHEVAADADRQCVRCTAPLRMAVCVEKNTHPHAPRTMLSRAIGWTLAIGMHLADRP